MKTTVLMTMTVITGISMTCWAQDAAKPAEKPAQEVHLTIDEVDAKIADLQRQKEILEQKKAEAEQLAELQEQLVGLRNDSQDRVKDADEQLAAIDKEEPPTTTAQRARVEGRRKFLNSRKAIDAKLLAITDAKNLLQARQLRDEVGALETEWRIVQEPKFNSAVAIEDLEASLAQNNNQTRRDMLEKLRQLAAKDDESRVQEYGILKAREEREKVWEKLFQDFNQAQ